MARRPKPYGLTARKRQRYWYFKLEDEATYRPTDVEIRWGADGKPTNRAEAERWIYSRILAHESEKERRREPTYGQLLRAAWTYDGDPRIAHRFTRWSGVGRPPIQDRTIREARARVVRYVIGDEEEGLEADPVAGARPSDGVRPWLDWQDRHKAAGATPRVLNQLLKETTTTLNYRVSLGDIPFHPVAAVPKLDERTEEEEEGGTGIYSAAELGILLSRPRLWGYSHPALDGHKAMHRPKQDRRNIPQAHGFAVLMAATCARPIELRHVRWKDVDLEREILRLRYLKVTGTGGGGRRVPLARQAAEALREIHSASIRTAPDDLVFADDKGRMRSHLFFRKRWQHAVWLARLPANDEEGRERHLYSMKHSVISLLLARGVHPHDVADLAGHSKRSMGNYSLTMAQTYYAKRTVEHLRQAIIPIVEQILDGTHIIEEATR
jgi:integrase